MNSHAQYEIYNHQKLQELLLLVLLNLIQYNILFGTTISHKTFEANSSFHVK